MDIFKLLSRSSKTLQPNPPSSQKLPSSGAVASPQLFGHGVCEQSAETLRNSRKRKREAGGQAVASLSDVPDFFETTSRISEAKRIYNADPDATRNAGKPEVPQNSLLHESPNHVKISGEPYDQDECKRTLRAHKLRVVVLEDYEPQEVDHKSRKENSKKRKREKEDTVGQAKSNTKKQLIPRPLTAFVQLRSRYRISKRLMENIENQGYSIPTEVQLGALPLLLGRTYDESAPNSKSSRRQDDIVAGLDGDIDLLTIAPTGSGKTLAFLIPIINQLIQAKVSKDAVQGPRAIVLAPTRELASQIVNEARKLAIGTGVKASLMKKGVEVVQGLDEDVFQEIDYRAKVPNAHEGGASSSEDDIEAMERPNIRKRRAELIKAAILVSTPLALVNALRRHDGLISKLPHVHSLVLDEADVLLDPLFREQTLSIWNACPNPSLRVGLWSATMGSNIESLATEMINNRWTSLSAPSSLPRRPPLIRLVVGLKDSAIPNISHKLVYAATEQGKLLGLRQLLHPTAIPSSDAAASLRPPFLVFTQTIPRATALHSELLYDIPPEAGGSSRIAVLHADLSSGARESIMTRFRRGDIWVLITTDLLARGVDFRGLNGVVNYDVPNSAAAYVHRVGRTGRAGREGGVAVTFYTQEDIPYIKNVANVIHASEKVRGKGEGEASVKQWLLDALPTPTKRDKQRLKKRGVEARRAAKDGEGKGNMRISTKSGYERRIGNNLRGAKGAARRRKDEEKISIQNGARSGSDFEEFEDEE